MTKAHKAMRAKARTRAIPVDLIVANAYAVPGAATTHEATIGARMREAAKAAGHRPGLPVTLSPKEQSTPRRKEVPAGTREILEWVKDGPQRRNGDAAARFGLQPDTLASRLREVQRRGMISIQRPRGADRVLGARVSITASGRRWLAEQDAAQTAAE